MSKFICFGSSYRVLDEDDVQIFDELPPRTYTVTYDDLNGFGLSTIDDFELPSRLYGSTHSDAVRIMATFMDRDSSTGIHLSGVKGSGKTLLAKTLSVMAREAHEYPTIVINKNYHGDQFNQFIQAINTPAVVMFDEFEKVYGWNDQDKILTLLDGVYPSKKLFIITSNERGQVNHYLRNRPGRIYYSLTFNSLSVDFVVEYCEENLRNKEHIDSIAKYVSAYTFFSFDMLAAVVEEMNRYDQNLIEVLDFLNIEPESGEDETYTISVWLNGVEHEVTDTYRGFEPNRFEYDLWPNELDTSKIDGPSMAVFNSFCQDSNRPTRAASQDEFVEVAASDGYICFEASDFVSFDPAEGRFTYEIRKGQQALQLTATRNPKRGFSTASYLL